MTTRPPTTKGPSRPEAEVSMLKTGVIVIGSGGAGLCAAAAAAEAGVSTVLVTKGRAGLANCTAYAGGGFTVSPPMELVRESAEEEPGATGGSTVPADEAAAPPRSDPENALTPDSHYRLSLETGRHLPKPDLLGQVCFRGTEALQRIERDYGVRLDWRDRGCGVTRFGRPPLLGGVGLTEPLVAHLGRAHVPIIERAVVTDIILDKDGVAGVLAVLPSGRREGGPSAVAIMAPAVIVATGGGGSIYGRTDNPPRMTGDGYALLTRCGAVLEDMEFVQFYPVGVAEPGMAAHLLDTSLLDLARVTDETGAEPLAGRYAEWGARSWAEVNIMARDKAAVALARLISAGHRLYLHTEEMPGQASPDELEWVKYFFPPSMDPFARPVQVAPTQHYFCGGVVIDTRGRVFRRDGSAIPGLYACGEVTSGVDGANRVGGNALTNIVVFGLAAGDAAASYVRTSGKVPAGAHNEPGGQAGAVEQSGPGDVRPARSAGDLPGESWRSALSDLMARLDQWLTPGPVAGPETGSRTGAPVAAEAFAPRPKPRDLRRKLNELCDAYLGPVRSVSSLSQATAALTRLAGEVGRLAVSNPSDLLLALELGPACATAIFVAQAALARTESRGAHFREDYPQEDPQWLKHVGIGL